MLGWPQRGTVGAKRNENEEGAPASGRPTGRSGRPAFAEASAGTKAPPTVFLQQRTMGASIFASVLAFAESLRFVFSVTGSEFISKPRRRRPKPRAVTAPTTALLLIDDQPLRDEVWQRFQELRRRLEKATRELHQHEEVDVPAFEAWKHRTFPLHMTALRELEREVFTKARRVQEAQARAAHTGRSVKRVWQEVQDAHGSSAANQSRPADDEQEDTSRRRQARLEDFFPEPPPKPARVARDIYRRLVQRLHPDHGGEWTPARQKLWHQVQAAWDAGDVDCLARLEVEWEAAHDVLGPQSPVSRLREAVEELHAAERDLEHKFAAYHGSPAWHFTRANADHKKLERRVETQLGRDYRALRAQLRDLNAKIELWEEDWTRPRPRERRPRTEPASFHEVFRRARRTSDAPLAED